MDFTDEFFHYTLLLWLNVNLQVFYEALGRSLELITHVTDFLKSSPYFIIYI